MTFYFVDFEASSLGSGSFPVEVAWVDENGEGESHLIRPEPAWTDWSPQSEHVHGISRSWLLQQGKPADWVARRALTALTGAILVSDNPAFDAYWLAMLFNVIWKKTEMDMVDVQSLVGQEIQRLFALIEVEADSPEWRRQAGLFLDEGRVLAAHIIEAETQRQRIKHRALQDAESLWRSWRAVQRAVDERLLNRSVADFASDALHTFALGSACPDPADRGEPSDRSATGGRSGRPGQSHKQDL